MTVALRPRGDQPIGILMVLPPAGQQEDLPVAGVGEGNPSPRCGCGTSVRYARLPLILRYDVNGR